MGTRARSLSGKHLCSMGGRASGRPAGGLLAPEVDVRGASWDPKGNQGGRYGRLMRPKMADFVVLMSLCSGITTYAGLGSSRESSGDPRTSREALEGARGGAQRDHAGHVCPQIGAPHALGKPGEASQGSRGVTRIPKGLKCGPFGVHVHPFGCIWAPLWARCSKL